MKSFKFYLIFWLFFSVKLFGQKPVIDSFFPGNGYAGDVITIYGKYLSPVTNVSFGGVDGYSIQQESMKLFKSFIVLLVYLVLLLSIYHK